MIIWIKVGLNHEYAWMFIWPCLFECFKEVRMFLLLCYCQDVELAFFVQFFFSMFSFLWSVFPWHYISNHLCSPFTLEFECYLSLVKWHHVSSVLCSNYGQNLNLLEMPPKPIVPSPPQLELESSSTTNTTT